MQVICSVCGKPINLTKAHKDYQKIAKKNAPYICEKCGTWIQFQMQSSQVFRKVQ